MSLHYNHPYWPSPRAARIARLLLEKNSSLQKPAGRMTHDKALELMAFALNLSVHEFLHVRPLDALQRLKLADNEEDARAIIGDNGINYWWILGGTRHLPCCVCDRILEPAPEPAPAEDMVEELQTYIAMKTGMEVSRHDLATIIKRFKEQATIIDGHVM